MECDSKEDKWIDSHYIIVHCTWLLCEREKASAATLSWDEDDKERNDKEGNARFFQVHDTRELLWLGYACVSL